MAAGGLLVFLYVLSDFGAVALLDYRTLTVLIYTETRTSFELSAAAVIGVLLVLLTLAVIVVERLLRGRPAPVRAQGGVRPPTMLPLGRWRWPAALLVCLPAILGAGLPLAVMGYRAFIAEGRSDSTATLFDAALTSIGLSAAAAAVAVVVALPVALLAVRHRSAYSGVVEGLAVSGYALPGLVIALALVFLATRFTPWLYQTLALVVVAYVVRFLPEALGAVRSSLGRIDPAVEEAARSLGRRPPVVLATVTLPMLRGGLIAGGALVFLTAMKELPATLLLQPPGYDTLATRVWTGANEGFFSQAAPPGLLIVAVSAVALLPVRRLATRAGGETRETQVVPS
jgi:iron(III) transport system permease protein